MRPSTEIELCLGSDFFRSGALLTTWVTFAPCFLLIFLGAPYVERLRGNKALAGILSGITAAAGVITNLALYFAVHIFFSRAATLDCGPVHLQLPDLLGLGLEQVRG